jgi:DNA processing protein
MDVLRATLALIRTPGLGPHQFEQLCQALGNPPRVLEAPREALVRAGLNPAVIDALKTPDWEGVEQDLRWRARDGHHIVQLGDSAYPALLAQIPDPPPLLFVAGAPLRLAMPQIAIVGSRNATAGGRETALAFAAELAGMGWTITSGLAVGIDAAAHEGALSRGHTVAVAATGLDEVYPSGHRNLARRIAEHDAVVSELPLGRGPRREHFPRRNRLISGLSSGVLVVEAAERSGSLITARHALQQGREVFAIPGSIHNPLARGCHRLIREGAKLVETVDDIVEELGTLARSGLELEQARMIEWEGDAVATAAPGGLDAEYLGLLETMGFDPVSVDLLVQRSGLTAESVSSMLLILELRGHVTAAPGGIYTRVR